MEPAFPNKREVNLPEAEMMNFEWMKFFEAII